MTKRKQNIVLMKKDDRKSFTVKAEDNERLLQAIAIYQNAKKKKEES